MRLVSESLDVDPRHGVRTRGVEADAVVVEPVAAVVAGQHGAVLVVGQAAQAVQRRRIAKLPCLALQPQGQRLALRRQLLCGRQQRVQLLDRALVPLRVAMVLDEVLTII